MADIANLMDDFAHEMGFRHFALIHHDDLRADPPERVKILRYPSAIADRIIGERHYRRDPIIRGCIFSDSAFLWSRLATFMTLNRADRESFAFGLRHGLNEGITVPCTILGDCTGSCTFAGLKNASRAERFLGSVQMVGIFAFQAARRIVYGSPLIRARPRLHPRPRDCVVLAGRGLSNKQIARALGLTPRTVDGYMTEARRLFDAHDRTELVICAILAGEVGLHELQARQPG
ncbi:MAG TPA: LuxR family transcriptional regulator [Sphingobium sp.]|uniref:LuxR family transcriptional regulator n=1 Tax=Sphingobium sp. TaxID=1912891 RepID=UPI002ED25640